MRPKQDPQIRREAFITAAAQLFSTLGYESVSVRDILDAVGDKSSSPSVFYYYFKSKEELYRCTVKSIAREYIASFENSFADDNIALADLTPVLFANAAQSLAQAGKLISGAGTTSNRLFMLDMREEVTDAIAHMWVQLLIDENLADASEAEALALYIAGGIGQLMFSQLERGAADEAHVQAVMRRIAQFTSQTLGISLETLGAYDADSTNQQEEHHGHTH